MMMPANFSAVNAEVVYGGAVDAYLPDAWTSKNFKILSTNALTILSNTFTSLLVNATLGTMFGGTWGDGAKLFGDDGSITSLFKYQRNYTAGKFTGYDDTAEMTFLNKFMTTLGVSAAVYTLGTTGVKNTVGEKKFITIVG